jgi:hypothetical protein
MGEDEGQKRRKMAMDLYDGLNLAEKRRES